MDIPDLLHRLRGAYPDPRYELDWSTPFELLVATVLAARCTDALVNQVTPALFRRYPRALYLAVADPAELETLVSRVTFYQRKATMLREMSQQLIERHRGEVPRTMGDLTALTGVGRKTANVVLTEALGLAEGVIVDTHVARVAQRAGLTRQSSPDKIEQDLMALLPQDSWGYFGLAAVLLGRQICTTRDPRCGACPLAGVCPKIGVQS